MDRPQLPIDTDHYIKMAQENNNLSYRIKESIYYINRLLDKTDICAHLDVNAFIKRMDKNGHK